MRVVRHLDRLPRGFVCPIIRSVPTWVGQCFEQHAVVKDVPAHDKEDGLECLQGSFPTQIIFDSIKRTFVA